jgi:low temperature requirement protein LtrA
MREFDVGERRATWLELFFDLCFVAAVAALANVLAHDPTWRGIWHFTALFVPVWWAWMAFTWFSTAWDNDDLVHRLGMFVAMLLVIVLAAGIPRVVRGRDAMFVGAYAAMQFVLATMLARVRPHAGEARRLVKIYLWGDVAGGLVWLGSMLVPRPARYFVWAVGLAILMIVPVFAIRAYRGQPYDSRHIPERYGLFLIVVLGESVVGVAAELSDRLNVAATATAGLAFAIAAAIWWSYFETVSSSGLSRDRLGDAFLWGYGHLFGYAGIAAGAVGLEFAIDAAAADGSLAGPARAMLCVGPAAFLLALAVIHKANTRGWDMVLTQRVAAMGLLVLLAAAGGGLAPVVLTAGVLAVLVTATALDVHRVGGEGLAADHLDDELIEDLERE